MMRQRLRESKKDSKGEGEGESGKQEQTRQVRKMTEDPSIYPSRRPEEW